MRKFQLFTIVAMAIFLMNCSRTEKISYPVTKKVDTVDNYFGTKVADPYRWLENDKAEDVAEWVKAQDTITYGYLSKIPFRSKIKERMEKIWNYPRYGAPHHEGKYYFFSKNDGMQNQSVLYIQEGLDGEPKVFLDPNTLSKDGTVALSDYNISKDAKYFAYATATSGSDWNEIFVMEIPSGKKLADEIKWVKFSGISWQGDGFYYSRYDEPKQGSELSGKNEFHKVYYHKIGTLQSADKLIYENKKFPLRNVGAGTTYDEKYLILSESEGTSGNSVLIKDLSKPKSDFKVLAQEDFKYDYSVLDNFNNEMLVLTNADAPKYKLVLIDPAKPEKQNWKTVIPEKQDVLQGVSLFGGKIIAQYMKDASSKAYVFDFKGNQLYEIALPGIGTLGGFSAKKEDTVAFYSYTSFTFPNTIFKFNVNTNKSEVFKKPAIDFNSDEYETKQVFYTSKDGTKVPMFIVHKKGLNLDGNNPTLLYGYGGFNVSETPFFSNKNLILLENGGVFALANIRGGGEYGEEWHKAGTKLNKQNVFDDFIAAAEYLIKEKYTSSAKLAINGGSNGGLLIGACMLQRPELFAVAFPAVGVLDMLRYHKFTIGWAWEGDYGSSADSVQFANLIKYSPVHNVKEGVEYPATMITTADHDDRVVPAHSFKFAATLQEKYKGNKPMLIRIETKAGHGAGKPTSKVIEEYTDMWSFMFYNMGITPKY